MVEKSRPQVIALEEHYWDRNWSRLFKGGDLLRVPALEQRLYDLGELRSRKWTRPASTIQVISHGASSRRTCRPTSRSDLDAAGQRPAARRRASSIRNASAASPPCRPTMPSTARTNSNAA